MNAAKSHTPILAPSILAGNHARLASSAELIHSVGLKWVHLDIMDGHFVPNLTFGPQAVADLRQDSTLFFDTHLMLDNPQDYIEAFAKAGADTIGIHVKSALQELVDPEESGWSNLLLTGGESFQIHRRTQLRKHHITVSP